jgi:hypothetical protein
MRCGILHAAHRVRVVFIGGLDAEPQRSDHSLRFMMILRTAVCVAAIMCVADTAPAIAKKARFCEYGRCWQTGAEYDYQYGYRPPTKWEQKGFCPPGQAKKGNC